MSTLQNWLGIALLSAAIPGAAVAQALGARVDAVRDGIVTFHYAARDGVCGNGRHWVRFGRSTYFGEFRTGDVRSAEPCEPGPVVVRITRREGSIRTLRAMVGSARDTATVDLGAVGAREATTYLLQLAARESSGRVSEDAMFAAVLADSADGGRAVWPRLLEIARDSTRPRQARRQAAHWLSRYASAATRGEPDDLASVEEADEGDERSDVKRHAVFVLAQQRNREGVAPLLRVAETHRDPAVRASALFWLGQSGDPRALDLFERLLRR